MLCCKMILKQKVNKVINKCHFDVFLISFKQQSNNLKCYTHFNRDRPDLSNDVIINRLMDIFNVRTMNF
jgi:hypothetical protein